jgi:hypothetical protein
LIKIGKKAREGVVIVEWVDSSMDMSGWSTEEGQDDVFKCYSAGVISHIGKKFITVSPHWTGGYPPQHCGDMTIPRVAITKIKVLK